MTCYTLSSLDVRQSRLRKSFNDLFPGFDLFPAVTPRNLHGTIRFNKNSKHLEPLQALRFRKSASRHGACGSDVAGNCGNGESRIRRTSGPSSPVSAVKKDSRDDNGD